MPASPSGVVSGDPVEVAAAARALSSVAAAVQAQAVALRAIASAHNTWSGAAALQARTRTATLPPKLDKATTSYSAAGSALLGYAQTLADAQARSAAAVSAATRAAEDAEAARAAQAAASQADAQAAAAATASGAMPPPPTAARYQASIDDAERRLAQAQAANEDAHALQREAAIRAAAAVRVASHEGIRNRSWWQHVEHSVAHWTSTHWHQALTQFASAAGTISLIAGVAAAVLAVGGIFFPPLEAAAAAADGLAFVSGALSAASKATDELTTPGQRRRGILTLGTAFAPGPAGKLLRKLPIRPRTEMLAVRGLPRTVPLGMRDEEEFRTLGAPLRSRLDELGYPGAVIRIRGSSVTGVRHDDGLPFDSKGEGTSDYDLGISDARLFEDARQLGAQMATETRTWPLDKTHALRDLGLESVRQHMTDVAGRDVSFMIYRDEMAIIRRGPSLRFPR